MKTKGYFNSNLPCIIVLVSAIFFMPDRVLSQEKGKVILDGTEGEVLEVTDTPTIKKQEAPQKKKKSWNTFDFGFTTMKVGGGFLVDYSTYSQDGDGKDQMDSAKVELEPGFKVRDSRIALSGKFKTKRSLTWRAGFMYDGLQDAWFVRETGLMIGVPELWGSFFIGRTKEGVSMSRVMNGYSGEFMERHMAVDVIPLLADGIKWLGYLPKQRIFWNLGVFTDWLSKGQSFSTHASQVGARVGFLPIHSTKENLHVAINLHIGRPQDDSIRVRSKPEASAAPYFIDSGKFPTDHSTFVGWEVYYTTGPWMFGTEYKWDRFRSSQKQDPVFAGGELMASYSFTGETRPYYTETGIYGFVPVKNSVLKGGHGAVDLVLRFSTLDLDDGLIKGGKFWRISPQVNWYLTQLIRLEFMYGYGVLDRFNIKGTTQFFQSRLQLTL